MRPTFLTVQSKCMYETPLASLRDDDTLHSVHRSQHEYSFAVIPTQQGSVPLNPPSGLTIRCTNVANIPLLSTPKTWGCCETLCAAIIKDKPTMAINLTSRSVHSSHDKCLVWSISCCRLAVLPVVIIFNCRMHSKLMPFSLRSRERQVAIVAHHHLGGEALSDPYY